MTLSPGDGGVDLSNHNHPNGAAIDYAQLAASKKFAYILLTDGTSFQNGYGVTDARGCQGAGMASGAYQFFRPDESFDEQMVDFTKYYLAIGRWTLPPMIDCETVSVNGMAFTARVLGEFQTNMRTALGVDVGVYLNLDFYDNMEGAPWGWPFWLADPSHPSAPSKPCLLQQTGTGSVPGISGPVDLDVWRGNTLTPPLPPLPEGIDMATNPQTVEVGGSPQAFGLTSAGHLIQIFIGTGWQYEDITAAASAPSLVEIMEGIEIVGGSPQPFGITSTGHVIQHYVSGTTWVHEDTTAASGAPALATP